MKRARYAIETRTPSKRTSSGWTKWQHWIVAETRADAERADDGLAWWRAAYRGESRIVDREVDDL